MTNIKGAGKIVNIQCTEILNPVFPSLLFGIHTDGSEYFDATNYLQSTSESNLSVEDFFQKFDYHIQSYLNVYGIDTEKTVYINSEGHQLINGCLCYLFLSYVDPQFCVYCNDVIDELFNQGVVISDTKLISLVKQRLSPELLNKIWEDERLLASSTSSADI